MKANQYYSVHYQQSSVNNTENSSKLIGSFVVLYLKVVHLNVDVRCESQASSTEAESASIPAQESLDSEGSAGLRIAAAE